MNRDAMHFICDQIRQVCKPRPWLFADGVTRMAEGRLAYAIGDQLAQDKLMCKVGRGCSVCWAPAKKLDYTNKIWPLRDSAALLRSMQHLANDCLNDAGEVKHGKSQAIKEWEKEIEPKKSKKRKSKIEELKLPYNPEEEASDPRSWSDNPEDYLK